ncbi:MAG TPA: class I SAM-dependent methyltransferase [Devosia sp.]|nr:class I SAM-dependent methyltransferase [Devosia sp.]
MSDNAQHWDGVFGLRGEEELTWFQASAEPSLSLISEFAGGTAGGIIDVGAGASRLVDGLLEHGFTDIALLDISRKALDRTSQRLSKHRAEPEYITADITSWQPARKWHVWHDRAVFHFLTSRADQDAYLRALKAATGPASIVVIGTFTLEGPEKCSGLPVQRYSPETLARRLGPDFALLKGQMHKHITPARNVQKFAFSVLRRSPHPAPR